MEKNYAPLKSLIVWSRVGVMCRMRLMAVLGPLFSLTDANSAVWYWNQHNW